MENEKKLSTEEIYQKWLKEAKEEERTLVILGGVSLAAFFVADAIYLIQLYGILCQPLWRVFRDSSFLLFCLTFASLLTISIISTIKIRIFINKNSHQESPQQPRAFSLTAASKRCIIINNDADQPRRLFGVI